MTTNKVMFFGNHGQDLFERVKEKLGPKFTPKFNVSGVTFYGPKGTRIMKLVYRRTYIEAEFNVPVPPVPGLTVLGEKEARNKKMGTCQWVYKGNNPELVLQLTTEALKNYLSWT